MELSIESLTFAWIAHDIILEYQVKNNTASHMVFTKVILLETIL